MCPPYPRDAPLPSVRQPTPAGKRAAGLSDTVARVILAALAGVVALAWARALWVTVVDWGAAPGLTGALPLPGADARLVSVVVPARNEAANIERCVRSLLAQRWPRLAVIAVDDASEDATGEILARLAAGDARLSVVSAGALPAGWLGKNHACAVGAARARGELVLFTDADSVHAPDCLARAVAALDRLGGDLLTLVPAIVCVGIAEKLLQPAILGLLFTLDGPRALNEDRARFPLANGQYLLFRRAAYDRVGGHAAVKDRVLDDLALAKATLAAGLKVRLAHAPDDLRVRMYTSFAELWWGYAKSNAAAPAMFLGLEGTPLRRAAAVALGAFTSLWILAQGLAPVLLLGQGGVTRILAAAGLALSLATRAVQNRRLFGLSAAWALTLPLGHAVSACINAHSVWRLATNAGPRWKGRTYASAR